MSFECVSVTLGSAILAGSLTNTPILVGNVTVEDFQAGFNIDGNDFKDISFD